MLKLRCNRLFGISLEIASTIGIEICSGVNGVAARYRRSTRKTSGESDLGVPFSVVAESRLRVSPRHSPFYCRFQRWSDDLSSFYLVFVWWSRRLGGHSDVAMMCWLSLKWKGDVFR